MKLKPAPELTIAGWLNTAEPLSLSDLRGQIVLLEAFQMLCPGCVSHALPQARRVAEHFTAHGVAVIGLHSVFEHHQAQGSREALAAFLHEYRIAFPVAMDAPGDAAGERDGLPRTMAAYAMQGTPTTILIDRQGLIRRHSFGAVTDLALGAAIGALLAEGDPGPAPAGIDPALACTPEGCPAP
ncbi:MAG: redoxin domain-containing protein [Pseudomonadota bacterium]|nr:redoxin domain-containing protein [Pseudomonadota bacterium]